MTPRCAAVLALAFLLAACAPASCYPDGSRFVCRFP